jgi:retinol dehydrogenase-12
MSMLMLKALPGIFWNQWTTTPQLPKGQSFDGQIIIVTGANIGLGFEAAKHIVSLNAAKVILAVRSAEKGEVAKHEIETETGKTGVVEVWSLDLQSFESVKAFAARAAELPRLDVLLENAGISTMTWTVSEGHESTITTNVISTFLLSLLLLPKLKESSQKYNITPRIVIVSSDVHFWTTLPERNDASGSIFGTLADQNKYRVIDRYNVSKVLEVFTVRQIVEDEAKPGYPIIINAVNPGLCHSGLMREVGGIGYVFKLILGARTTEVGARTLVSAALMGEESHGKYLSDCMIKAPSPFVTSAEGQETQKRVWKELKEILEGIQPGISKNF